MIYDENSETSVGLAHAHPNYYIAEEWRWALFQVFMYSSVKECQPLLAVKLLLS